MNPSRPAVKPGLYAITPSAWPEKKLLAAVDELLESGLSLLQYRNKPAACPELASALLARCRAATVPLIINDDIELAERIGADGVHLGRDDGDPAKARERLGPAALIGVSCYNDLDRARQLAKCDIDYLAFGSVFSSPTKPAAVSCPLELLGQARQFGLPVVAIGGINTENAPLARAAGADLLAVITDLFDNADIGQQALSYRALYGADPETD
ncbi:MAG: thiamine phosphate synthase [Wenzhouxiangella sp.]|nr:thiamine phosphate synthase [Wenzhouxiangella sp.]MCH8478055.1 thiamine phosphate synthase [Wenzhouxiangella sp.]